MATENPFFISEMNTSITNPIRDDLDFPHSGLFKAFGQMVKGSYPVKASETDFDITLADGGTFSTIAVAAGKVFRHGKLITVSALSAVTMNTAYDDGSTSSSSDLTPHATLDVYLLIVVNGSGAIKIRGDSDSGGNNYSGGKIPKLMDWAGTAQPDDVIVAVVKLPAGIADDAYASIQVQYITTSQDDKSLSIGYASSDLYLEALSISSDADGDVTIATIRPDKDLIFTVDDGGVTKTLMTLDADIPSVVFNDGQLDIDFRVESDASEYAIHLDAANEKIAIMGDGTPTQTLELNGSFAGKVTTITGTTASYSVVATDYTIIGHSTATPCTLTLPAASSHLGRILNFHQLDTGVMLFAFTGSDEASGFIAGSNQDTDTGVSLTQYQGLSMVSDGVSRWCIIGQSGPQA